MYLERKAFFRITVRIIHNAMIDNVSGIASTSVSSCSLVSSLLLNVTQPFSMFLQVEELEQICPYSVLYISRSFPPSAVVREKSGVLNINISKIQTFNFISLPGKLQKSLFIPFVTNLFINYLEHCGGVIRIPPHLMYVPMGR